MYKAILIPEVSEPGNLVVCFFVMAARKSSRSSSRRSRASQFQKKPPSFALRPSASVRPPAPARWSFRISLSFRGRHSPSASLPSLPTPLPLPYAILHRRTSDRATVTLKSERASEGPPPSLASRPSEAPI